MRAPWRYAAPTVLLVLTLAACTDEEPRSEVSASASPTPTETTQSPPTASASGSPSGSPSDATPPDGGTAEQPAVLTPRTKPLDWRPVPGPVGRTVTRSGPWALTVSRNGAEYSLDGPTASTGAGSTARRVSDALIDGDYAVVVLQDKAEQQPSRAEVTDLASGRSFTLDGSSEVPTTNGGTWALGGGRLLHATVSRGSYCLTSVDLAARKSSLGWCAPKRTGFNAAHVTPAGDSMLTFDDSRPSCRTVVSVTGDKIEPFPGVPDCKAWDGLLTDGGAVWSVIPKENQIESAHFYARDGDEYFDLGPGTAGSLVWCGGASYFVRDPQRQGDPAALMRWTADDGLTVAYSSPGGQAFLAEPRCGGSDLTVTALTQERDEQVTAPTS